MVALSLIPGGDNIITVFEQVEDVKCTLVPRHFCK
jgi:hypothetical protein